MVGDVEDEKRRDAFALRHVRDGGVVAMLLRVVPELLAVPELCLRLAMHPATRLSSLDDGRNIVGVAVHGNAALDDGEGESLGLQVAVVDANQGSKLGAGGVAHDENPLRIAAVLGDVVMHPADGLGDVAKDCAHVHVGQEAVARGDEDEAPVRERLRLYLKVRPVARLPAPAVNPEDHRQFFRTLRRVNVHFLPRVGWLGVGDVPLHVEFGLCGGGGLGLRQRQHEWRKG